MREFRQPWDALAQNLNCLQNEAGAAVFENSNSSARFPK